MKRVSRLTLGVSNLEESEAFYGRVLGLSIEHRDDDLIVQWPDFVLTLRHNPPAGRGKFHFGFQVENRAEVDAWAQKLRENGQVVSGPADLDGNYQLFVLDPDAYEIAIFA
ncbi:MAG TPA: VOC family protein [Candidatus Baltobacteraceae bacterium]|nr:VOC family protein [Candidatus Baltobacteraceae bacterium]